ncbi:hypothetical protein [Modestobacter sp. I12A-02662]|uniref:hypothetical protein n=1 Tax=Modestobacter sp. I12A-02662 TaxID=1730496 RepID=UPI0034DFDCDC
MTTAVAMGLTLTGDLGTLANTVVLLLLWQQEAGTWLRAGLMLVVGVVLYLLAQAPWWRGGRRRGGPAERCPPPLRDIPVNWQRRRSAGGRIGGSGERSRPG